MKLILFFTFSIIINLITNLSYSQSYNIKLIQRNSRNVSYCLQINDLDGVNIDSTIISSSPFSDIANMQYVFNNDSIFVCYEYYLNSPPFGSYFKVIRYSINKCRISIIEQADLPKMIGYKLWKWEITLQDNNLILRKGKSEIRLPVNSGTLTYIKKKIYNSIDVLNE